MKKNKKKIYDDDDGRVIAPMNVDGMPWNREQDGAAPKPRKGVQEQETSPQDELQLTPKEQRAMMGGVIAASLLVAGIFALAGLLFILFCVFVWLK